MKKIVVNKLTSGQIEFMEFWEKVLKHKSKVSISDLNHAATLINFRRSGNCSGCMRIDASNINNIYRGLLNSYAEYMDEKKSLELLEQTRTEPVDDVELPEVELEDLFKFEDNEPITLKNIDSAIEEEKPKKKSKK